MDFDIELSEEGLLTITPHDTYTDKNTFLTELIDSLFWEDMDLTISSQDGWTYISSMNHQLVWPMDDYGYDLIRDLQMGKKVEVMGRSNDDYQEYEWNEM
ncbi:MAG: hypothetical protein BWY45_03483 [Euryarchaeota archaeon ADurb.Bin294]|jgi:hypothetical protein|nr:MAG: hypothetical protein BWY45_03483 [Euryarchaeota archaeon ADurb.Bin294]